MTQEKPTTFLGRYTSMVNRDSHNKGYMQNQAAINQLLQEQTKQQKTLVHIISILNVT